MLSAIIENTITKEDEYLYLKNENNSLIYYGFSIQNSNVKPISKNIISKIYNLLRVHENCIYIEDYLDYKVYLDRENNIKHYLKNGVEDFLMLYKNNGEDLNVYNNSNRENNNSDGKKFKIDNSVVKLSKRFVTILPAILIGLSVGTFISTSIYKNIIDNFKSSNESITISNIESAISSDVSTVESTSNETGKLDIDKPNIVYSTPEEENVNLEPIDIDEAIELINSSSLPQSMKEIATNETLLKDVFEYYKDTNMEYVISDRLNGIGIEIYSKDYYKTGDILENVVGYYSELTPNVLHLREDIDCESVFKHEYIHLLQSYNCEYMYLIEATADIVPHEYLELEEYGYKSPVYNIKLLMDTIGPKVIWETVFGGDDTNLVNIIKNNLIESEANELISYLKQTPVKIDEENKHERITELISNLYRNINLKDIKEDMNIYDLAGNHIDKIYFNEEKMQESWRIIDCSKAQELGLVTFTYDELYLKEISKEEYDKLNIELQNNPEYQKLMDDWASSGMIDIEYQLRRLNRVKNIEAHYISTNQNVSVHWSPFSDFVILKNKMENNGEYENESMCKIEDALEKGLITAKYYEIVNGKNLTEEEKATYKWYSNKLSSCRSNKENVFLCPDENGILKNIEYMVPTIKEIFPDQTIRNNNSIIK